MSRSFRPAALASTALASAALAVALALTAAACGCPAPAAPAAPAVPTPAPLSPEHAALASRLDAVVTAAIAGKPMAGLSVAVVHRGETVLARGYGLADREAARPAAADTVYRIGSITKSFTAAAILRLAATGKLAIDDPITKYLPDYDTKGKTITLRHLLTHTSGIKGYTELDEFGRRMNEAFPRAELVRMFAAEPLMFEPGARWSYSNSGYYLLGLVIERVTGAAYADAVRDLVIRPAALATTAYCPPQMTAATEARGYEVRDDQVVPAAPLDMAHPYAAGSLCATAPELARWLAALVGHVAVDAAGWTQMTTPVTLTDGGHFGYGFGLQVGELGGHARIGHGGGINGFVSQMDLYPADELVVVVLTNAESALAPEVAEQLARAALAIPTEAVADLPLAAADGARYVGTYDFPDLGIKLAVRYQDGRLESANLDAAGQPTGWLAMRSQGDHVFVVPEVKARLTFVVTGDRATAVEVAQGGGRFRGPRVAD